MWDKNPYILTTYKRLSAILLCSGAFASFGGAALALTADDVLNKMNTEQQTSYIAGVVGGFAYSRYLRDQPDTSGMSCINNWYYGSGTNKWARIETWFTRHIEKQAEPLLYVLIKKECGK